MTYTPRRFRFEEHADLRARNRRIVEKWFGSDLTTDEGAAQMHGLFDEFGRKELRFRLEGTRELIGPDLLQHHVDLTSTLARWSWGDLKITGTQFPAVFWAFSFGSGTLAQTGEDYFNRFVHLFIVERGKIRLLREWLDPALELARTGRPVPYL